MTKRERINIPSDPAEWIPAALGSIVSTLVEGCRENRANQKQVLNAAFNVLSGHPEEVDKQLAIKD